MLASATTERIREDAKGLDTLPLREVALRLHAGQSAALRALEPALGGIVDAAAVMAETVSHGGTLIYAGAGSSGLMAAADAMELAGTFGIATSQVRVLMPGGLPTDATLPGDVEDSVDGATSDARMITPDDAVIVVTASGRTPYALTMARIAADIGAATICLANNPDAPIFAHARIPVCLPTAALV